MNQPTEEMIDTAWELAKAVYRKKGYVTIPKRSDAELYLAIIFAMADNKRRSK